MFDDDKEAFRLWCFECCGYDLDKIQEEENSGLFWALYNRYCAEMGYWAD